MRSGRSRHVPWCTQQVHRGIKHGLIRFAGSFFCFGKRNIPKSKLRPRSTSIVNQYVDCAEALNSLGDNISAYLRIRAVTGHGCHAVPIKTLVAQGVNKGVELLDISTGQHYAGALAQQLSRDKAANGARRTCQHD